MMNMMKPKALVVSDSDQLMLVLTKSLAMRGIEVVYDFKDGIKYDYVFVIKTTDADDALSEKLIEYIKYSIVKSVYIVTQATLKNLPHEPRSRLIVLIKDSERTSISDTELANFVNKVAFSYATGEPMFLNYDLKLATKNAKKTSLRRPILLLALLFWIIISPFVLLAAGGVAAYGSYKLAVGERLKMAGALNSASHKLSLMSYAGFELYRETPLVGEYFTTPLAAASLSSRGTELFSKVLKVAGEFSFEDGIYVSEDIGWDLDNMYEELSLIESDAKKLNITYDFARIRSSLAFGADMVGAINSEKTYLVLLQNSNELRPTGGFIGSFALISFQRGKLSLTQIYDVYSADGQLRGYIKPPLPLEKYLGEASWYMRDSNWDPDFSVSAERAMWFLDKSLEQKVDGVVAINLGFIRRILEKTGPIVLTDFSDTVTKDNVGRLLQSEIEDNFFEGSRKKATYLTAFYNELLDVVPGLDRVELAKIIYQSLQTKDVQIYLANDKTQSLARVLGISGQADYEHCSIPNCQSFLVSINEANLGVNKANEYITRNEKLFVAAYGDKTLFSLNLIIKNTAPLDSNPPTTRYKAYVRAIVNPDAEFIRSEQDLEIVVVNNKKEAGMLIDVPAGASQEIVYKWSVPGKLNLALPGQINLTKVKQSGVPEYPLSLSVSLTNGQDYSYNTSLSTDIVKKIDF